MKHVYPAEKIEMFRREWPKVKLFVRRGEYPNRKEYEKELMYQRYRLWRRIDLRLNMHR